MSTTSTTRQYFINDDGDAFELVLTEDGEQVGGAVFPIALGDDRAFDLAKRMGESFLSD